MESSARCNSSSSEISAVPSDAGHVKVSSTRSRPFGRGSFENFYRDSGTMFAGRSEPPQVILNTKRRWTLRASTAGIHRKGGDAGRENIRRFRCETSAENLVVVSGLVSLKSITKVKSRSRCKSIRKWFAALPRYFDIFAKFMLVFTIYISFADDIRLAMCTKSSDIWFNSMTICLIAVFSVEIVIQAMLTKDYAFGVLFCLDICSTLSLVLDLTFVWERFVLSSGPGRDALGSDIPIAWGHYTSAGASNRLTSQISRGVRVVRLIRVVRVLRLLLQCRRKLGHKRETLIDEFQAECDQENDEIAFAAGQSVAQKLTDKTTLTVFFLLFSMLVVIPMLDSGEANSMLDSSAPYGAEIISLLAYDAANLHRQSGGGDYWREAKIQLEVQILLYIYYHQGHTHCLAENADNCVSDEFLKKLCFLGYIRETNQGLLPKPRADSMIEVLKPDPVAWDTLFQSKEEASHERTLALGSLPEEIKQRLIAPSSLTCDLETSKLVGVGLREGPVICPWDIFRPQELFIVVPRSGRTDPNHPVLIFVFDMSEELRYEAWMSMSRTLIFVVMLTMASAMFSSDADKMVLIPLERMSYMVLMMSKGAFFRIDGGFEPSSKKRKEPTTMETKILENTLLKLGSLLAVGFGEAGTAIMIENLRNKNGVVNAMIPGVRVRAIYGYCQIGDFTMILYSLQRRTLVFINQVAQIVHGIADEHGGVPGGNMGDAFLVIWRIKHKSQESKLADLSVLAFVRVLIAVSRDGSLARHAEHPSFRAADKHFHIRLNFGLHLGSSIVGAIGSQFKFDVTYLSSHVSLAQSLEAMTGEYELSMLMSQTLVTSCNPQLSKFFRPVDRVKFHGMKDPIRLLTFDVDIFPLLFQEHRKLVPMQHSYSRKKRSNGGRDCTTTTSLQIQDGHSVAYIMQRDYLINVIRHRYQDFPYKEWEIAYLNYESGEWDVAQKLFVKTRGVARTGCHNDGPSERLLDYMNMYNHKAPVNWQGFRELPARGCVSNSRTEDISEKEWQKWLDDFNGSKVEYVHI